MHKENKKLKKFRKSSQKRTSRIVAGVLIILLLLVVLYVRSRQNSPAPGQQSSNSPTQAVAPAPGGGLVKPVASPSASPISNPSHPISSTLAAPTGQLLNKHSVSLSSTAPESSPAENSTCQTVPGASCDIRLTGPNGTIKYVGVKTTDDQGGANFNWNAKDLGLTPGRWKVEAVASKDGQTAVSSPDYLDVSP